MPADRTTTAKNGPPALRRAATQRSRVSNGGTLYAADGDMRTAWTRRMRDLLDQHIADLGGIEAISTAEASICRRSAVLTCELEKIEARFATDRGTAGDLDIYQRTAGNLRRLLESVGLQRRAKDVTQPTSIKEYLATRNGAGQ